MGSRSGNAAMIGAGVSGLACARRLREAGVGVRVFEKARGPGGRISTRRAAGTSFDHGAQFFTATDPDFLFEVESWRASGAAAVWDARFGDLESGRFTPESGGPIRYVGAPRMSSIARYLSTGIDLTCGARVVAAERDGGSWVLVLEEGGRTGPFDILLLSMPAPQAEPFLAPTPAAAMAPSAAEMAPCWTVMAAFDSELDLPYDAARVAASPLSWIARNTSKPGRGGLEAWVLQSTPDWATDHLDAEPGWVAAELLDAFRDAAGRAGAASWSAAHRWMYARVLEPAGDSFFYDEGLALGACGDWCLGDRMEAAWLSGVSLAARVLAEA